MKKPKFRINRLGTYNRCLSKLSKTGSSGKQWKNLRNSFDTLRRNYIKSRHDTMSNRCWFLKRFCQLNLEMCTAFEFVEDGDYLESWNILERAEISASSLLRNIDLLPANVPISETGLKSAQSTIESWQTLFPYNVFASPEFMHKVETCSICKRKLTANNRCKHIAGKVYEGRECVRIISDIKLGSIAVVTDPVQKFSVLLPQNPDYRLVNNAHRMCRSIYSLAAINKTTRQIPHSEFSEKESDLCPCGSGRYYHFCCKKKDGVTFPHYEIILRDEPKSNMEPVFFR